MSKPKLKLKPINEDNDQAERLAARHGLHFHITSSRLYEHRGHASEDREATPYEQQMWEQFVIRDLPESGLDVTAKELESCLRTAEAHYINSSDYFYAIKSILRDDGVFEPCTMRDLLMVGYVGSMRQTPLFIWSAIPKGYYLVKNELKFKPLPEVTPELARELGLELRPFKEGC